MNRLEKHLGFPLFRRNGRHVVPTKEAIAFHVEASRVTRDFRNLFDVAAGIVSATRGTITIGSSPAPAIFWLPLIIAKFQRERPEVHVRLISRSSREIRELGDYEAFDIGVAEAPFTRRDGVMKRYKFEMVALTRQGSDLARNAILTPRLISGRRLVAVKGALWTDADISRAFEVAQVDMPVVAECDYMASAIGLVSHGDAVCLVDPVSASQLPQSAALEVRKFSPSIHYEIGVITPARGGASQLTLAFAQSLDDFLRSFSV
jgi:DNA-binding transcriptional LysR family regulator